MNAQEVGAMLRRVLDRTTARHMVGGDDSLTDAVNAAWQRVGEVVLEALQAASAPKPYGIGPTMFERSLAVIERASQDAKEGQ